MTTIAADLYLLVAAYGLAIAVSYAGLPVLGQGAFVAVGSVTTVQLAAHGTPVGVAVMCAVALAAVGGHLVGFAAARLSGAPLALATWGLAWLVYTAALVFPRLSGGTQGLTRATPARLVSPALGVAIRLTPAAHVVIAALVCLLAALALRRAGQGAIGLDLAALRSGPALADSLGVPVQRRRRAVLATAGALGGLGGAGTALLLGVVGPADYSPLLSLQLFVAVLLGGVARWWGPPIGVALLAALPSTADALATLVDVDAVRARALLTALLLVVALGIRGPVHRLFAWVPTRPVSYDADVGPPATACAPRGMRLLELDGVAAAYGAVRVIDHLDLDLDAGEVHALVGPNGSGKSTALRIAAGVLSASGGAVHVQGVPAADRGGAARRVRAGVARTLQRTVALGELDAATQVAVGARAREQTLLTGLRELFATARGRAASSARARVAAECLALVGLGDRAAAHTSTLDSAQQRLLQIARAAATGAPALLLDEPAAGMSAPQRTHLVGVLRALAARGHGVLLVEHDMALVARAADRVTVIAEGRVIASGPPDVVRRSADVARAYLGDDSAAQSRK